MKEELHNLVAKVAGDLKPRRIWPRILLTAGGLLVALAIVIFFGAGIYSESYRNRVYPGVYLGNYPVGGLQFGAVKGFIENLNNRLAKEGIALVAEDSEGAKRAVKINTVVSGDSPAELVRLDSDAAASLAIQIGRSKNLLNRLFGPIFLRLAGERHLPVPVVVSEPALIEALKNNLSEFEDKPHNAALEFGPTTADYRVVPELAGHIYNYQQAALSVKNHLGALLFEPIQIKTDIFYPSVTTQDVNKILPNLAGILEFGALGLNYVDPQTKYRRDWNLTPLELAQKISVAKDSEGNFIFSLSEERMSEYLSEQVKRFVENPAEDAKFVMEGGKVNEFQASRSGLELNIAKTYADIKSAFEERNYRPAAPAKTVSLVVGVVEPKVKTADVNNLGITEVVGVGVSTFKDSHTNRIKNIANAVKRLNGVLIKPGEEFSANRYAGPYTAENGFLPEMVIKGREIKPEVGGGMCQIGTTLFRMAMNSGMDITQRRNHSLVVSYYADPVNGNPGTDATLYEPALDLKFLNDTGAHLLLQTDIDYKKQQLTFTLWGRPDGRKGWYTHPLVSKWIPSPETENIVVSDGSLKPGAVKCQNAFRGAVASFTYSRVTTSSVKIDRVFDSYYRPLPKICMIGATSTVAGSTAPAGGLLDVAE